MLPFYNRAQNTCNLGIKDKSGSIIPLQEMHTLGEVNDIYSSIEQTQVYENTGKKHIEAIYTFPLPSRAVILNMTVKLGEKELEGKVTERRKAERKYDEAIAEGSAAVMLEKIEEGLYTANVGNLRPGEKAEVRLRYAMLHEWNGGSLRLCLPTVIGERYGKPEGIRRDAVPVTDASVRHNYDLNLRFVGKIASADMSCASHKLLLEKKTEEEVLLSLDNALADRDFVLNIKPKHAVEEFSVLKGSDGAGTVIGLALTARPEDIKAIPPRTIDIVIDCSGSMSGTSIEQAREASHRILQTLRPKDSFALLAYGSDYTSLFGTQYQKATEENLAKAFAFLSGLDATMGGTETGKALNSIYQKKRESPSDILLITDGDFWATEEIFTKSKQSRCRIFPVGVGCASAEANLTQLANITHGKAEFVTPSENMAESIVRHFQRIASDYTIAEAKWPGKPDWQIPNKPETVFVGDTFYAFAGYSESPSNPLKLVVKDGEKERAYEAALPTEQEEENVLARLTAAQRLANMNQNEATRLAEKYQLVSQWTNYILVDKRDETNPSLPEKHIVPQMAAAGWGGNDRVSDCLQQARYERYTPNEFYCSNFRQEVFGESSRNSSGKPLDFGKIFGNLFPSQNFSAPIEPSLSEDKWNLDSFLQQLAENEQKDIDLRLPLQSLEDLSKLGLDEEIIKRLREVTDGLDEEQAVICFLKALVDLGHIRFKKQANLYTRMAERFSLTETHHLAKMTQLLSEKL